MINKRIYAFLVIALLSFVSLSVLPSVGFIQSTSESAIECVEQKNTIESEAKDFSYLSFNSNFAMRKAELNIMHKDKIYTLPISDNLLRPPIFS